METETGRVGRRKLFVEARQRAENEGEHWKNGGGPSLLIIGGRELELQADLRGILRERRIGTTEDTEKTQRAQRVNHVSIIENSQPR